MLNKSLITNFYWSGKVFFLSMFCLFKFLNAKCQSDSYYFIFILQITFCPNILDCKSIDYFHVITIGNISKTVVKCTGSSIGKILE